MATVRFTSLELQRIITNSIMLQNGPVIILASFAAFAVSAWLTRLLAYSSYILDLPNERSLHSTPVPRTGGLAIFFAIALAGTGIAIVVEAESSLGWLAAGALLIAAVSFVDDCFRLGAGYRIFVHAAAAGVLLYGGFSLSIFDLPGMQWLWPKAIGTVFTLLFVLWMVNLYNFMDGIDGLAGGMAVLGFGAFAIIAWQAGNLLFSGLSLVVSVSAAGFLVFNFPPAKIFLGDVGSSTLGFLAAAFATWGSMDGFIPLWASVLLFSPLIVDATVTLLRRLLQGRRVWEAHKTHYYQRLVRLGWSHRRTVLWEYCLMCSCAVSTLLVLELSVALQWSIIGFWCVLYALLIASVHRLEARR